jgi:hypothetical protein
MPGAAGRQQHKADPEPGVGVHHPAHALVAFEVKGPASVPVSRVPAAGMGQQQFAILTVGFQIAHFITFSTRRSTSSSRNRR